MKKILISLLTAIIAISAFAGNGDWLTYSVFIETSEPAEVIQKRIDKWFETHPVSPECKMGNEPLGRVSGLTTFRSDVYYTDVYHPRIGAIHCEMKYCLSFMFTAEGVNFSLDNIFLYGAQKKSKKICSGFLSTDNADMWGVKNQEICDYICNSLKEELSSYFDMLARSAVQVLNDPLQ